MPLTYFASIMSKCAFNKSLPICFVYSTDNIIYISAFFFFSAPLTSGSRLKVLGRATICVNCHSCLIIVFIFSHTTLNLTILVCIMFCKYGCFKSCNISATCSRSFKKSQTLNHTPYVNKILYDVRRYII